jgi:hypothetical protein
MESIKYKALIISLNPSIVVMRGDVAYDANGIEVVYDKSTVDAKLAELQAQATAKQEEEVSAKASAQAKLSALGLTVDEVKAILGTT